MNKKVFFIEFPIFLTLEDFKNLRKLYCPIAGANSIIVYEYLCDISENKYKKLFNFEEIAIQLGMDTIIFQDSLEKLEALGLINTFKKNNDNSFIFNLSKPHDIKKFDKNPLLKSHLIKLIGQKMYDNIYFEKKQPFVNKIDYKNISKKYQDVFANIFEENISYEDGDFYQTADLVVDKFETHEENVEKLPSSYFIKYLIKRSPSYYETLMINSISKMGFSDSVINLLIDFSVKFNDAIICPYIIKIAEDFHYRSIINFNDVKHEISIVENFKYNKKNKMKNRNIENSISKKNELLIVKDDESITTTQEINIEEIFEDEEIKDFF